MAAVENNVGSEEDFTALVNSSKLFRIISRTSSDEVPVWAVLLRVGLSILGCSSILRATTRDLQNSGAVPSKPVSARSVHQPGW